MNDAIELISRILREMWHRHWIGLIAAWVGALAGIVVVYQIPERYEASARVFVDTKSILKPLLQGLAVQPDVNQQVAMVSRTMINRPNVEKVIRNADLDLHVKDTAQRDELLDRTMRSISLASSRGGDNLYTISYRDPEPITGVYLESVTSNLTEPILPNAAHVQGSTRTIVAAFSIGEGVALNKNHTRLHIRKMLLTCGNWSTDVQSGAKARTAFILLSRSYDLNNTREIQFVKAFFSELRTRALMNFVHHQA